MEAEAPSIAETFQQYFTAELAGSEEQKLDSYRVRYRVYCEEFQYETPEDCPGGLETDEFDADSYHCIIRHRSSDRIAGCVRLVASHEERLMPIEKYCLDSINAECRDILQNDRQHVCEISRLAVDSEFRRRVGETGTRYGKLVALDVSPRERRTFSLIAVAAFLGAAALAEMTDRKRTFAMMEPFLPRLLSRSGIVAHPAGSEVDYHGTRAAYIMSPDEAVQRMKPQLRELYDAIHKNLHAAIAGEPGD